MSFTESYILRPPAACLGSKKPVCAPEPWGEWRFKLTCNGRPVEVEPRSANPVVEKGQRRAPLPCGCASLPFLGPTIATLNVMTLRFLAVRLILVPALKRSRMRRV